MKENSHSSLSAIDQKILKSLQSDSRMSNSHLAQQVNLSETPCWRRWKKLEEGGYIQDYRTVLDRRKLGYSVVAFVQVSFSSHEMDITDHFERVMQDLPWVQSCHCITGNVDYVVQIVARDLDDFSGRISFIRRIEGVHSIESSISVKEIKQSTDLPIGG